MRKFAVFSGFLGSGKTTAMMALTDYYTKRHGKAAMISNDLGHGVTLADHRLARLKGVQRLRNDRDLHLLPERESGGPAERLLPGGL